MGVGPPYKGGSFPTCMSMRTRGTSTRAPPPPPASPRHASSRRAAGCGNEPSRCKFLPRTTGIRKGTRKLKRFAVVEIEYERRTSSPAACSFRLPRSLQLPAQPLAFFSCAYKREVAPPRETHQNLFLLSPQVPEHCAAATFFLIPACGVHRTSGQ